MKPYKLRIPIGEIFKFLKIDNDLYESYQLSNRLVKIRSNRGEFVDILRFVKKRGIVSTFNLSDGTKIRCDLKHLVKQIDGNFSFIYNTDHVIKNESAVKIISKSDISNNKVDVYDIALSHPHEYVTSNDVVCHNTTLAKLITKNVECDVLYINASDENSVDTVRSKIKGFASTTGFTSLKVIVLDECLDENTLVYILRSGVEVKVKIKDVDEKSDLVKSFNVKLNKIEWRPFYLLNVGERDVVRIDLENGESVVCTEEHKWYVYDESDNIIKVKTKELLNGKYNYILSPE